VHVAATASMCVPVQEILRGVGLVVIRGRGQFIDEAEQPLASGGSGAIAGSGSGALSCDLCRLSSAGAL
jgi:hypothetical protein